MLRRRRLASGSAAEGIEWRRQRTRNWNPASSVLLPRIGIAVISHNRCEQVLRLVHSLRAQVLHPVRLAVFDDGSVDGTAAAVRPLVDVVLEAPNGGVVINKNRALFYFLSLFPVDQLIVLEDDVLISSPEWLPLWSEAIRRHGHVNFSSPDWPRDSGKFLGGEGTPQYPEVWNRVLGACMGIDMSLLRAHVGYLNPRFSGYGYAHIEWTRRFIRAGYGGWRRRGGRWSYLSMSQGIVYQAADSHRDHDAIARNASVMAELDGVGDYVPKPWLDGAGRRAFLAPFARWWSHQAHQKSEFNG